MTGALEQTDCSCDTMTKGKPHLYVIVPVLNEESNVPVLMQSFRELRDAVCEELQCFPMVVDDGSTDATVARIEECRGDLDVTVLSHDRNMGPGAAFGAAFQALDQKIEKNDWVVTMEGDNTSRIETLLQMLRRRHEGYDVVLASPYAYGGGILGASVNRVLLSHCANALAKLVLGLRGLHTLSSFFRLYSAGTLRRLQDCFGPRIIECAGFECMVELLVKLSKVGARISEVEMLLDWRNRKGKSKMRRLPAIWGYVKLLAKARKWANAGKTSDPREQ